LARAMDPASSENAHPSFAQTIQQLSPHEAVLLKEIAVSVLSKEAIFEQEDDPNRIKKDPTLLQSWQSFCKNCGIADAILASAYFNNLSRLGILLETADSRGVSSRTAVGTRVVTTRRLIVTPYGQLFLNICIR